MTEQYIIYTDGACSGNPGPGGHSWIKTAPLTKDGDVVLVDGKEQHAFIAQGSGGEKDTTNNRMELMAVIKALTHMRSKVDADITIITDSKYVLQGITEWIKGWKTKGWIGSNKKPVKNQDLWKELDGLASTFKDLKWKWVKGHSGNSWNEAVDQLAVSAIPKG